MNINCNYDHLSKYLKKVSEYEILNKEEEQFYALDYYYNRNELSRRKLINSNYKLVVWCLKSFFIPNWLDVMDVVQSGNLGLILAVDKFDPNKGFNFSTYAVYYIKLEIQKFISEQYRTFNMGTKYYKLFQKYNLFEEEYFKINGTKPSDEEIINYLQINKKQLDNIRKISNKPVSLDGPILNYEEDDGDNLYEIIANSDVMIEQNYDKKELATLLKKMLNSLDERSSDMLKMRFGISPYHNEYSLKEIGEKYNVTKQRVAKIIEAAESDCRNIKRASVLKDYVNTDCLKEKSINKK